jgi:hypothetical protein
MKNYLRMTAALALSFMGSALVPTLKADDWVRKTRITIDQSIDVQGTVLPPGSFVISFSVRRTSAPLRSLTPRRSTSSLLS